MTRDRRSTRAGVESVDEVTLRLLESAADQLGVAFDDVLAVYLANRAKRSRKRR